jgi:hypothetical protein
MGGSGRQWVARGVDNWFVQGKANGETTVGLLSAVMAGKGGSGSSDRQPTPPLHRGPYVAATLLLENLGISALM